MLLFIHILAMISGLLFISTLKTIFDHPFRTFAILLIFLFSFLYLNVPRTLTMQENILVVIDHSDYDIFKEDIDYLESILHEIKYIPTLKNSYTGDEIFLSIFTEDRDIYTLLLTDKISYLNHNNKDYKFEITSDQYQAIKSLSMKYNDGNSNFEYLDEKSKL